MNGILYHFIRDKTRMFAVILLVPTLTGCFADLHRLFELTCHFRVQYLAIATAFACASFIMRDWRWAAVALLSVAINGAAIAPDYFAKNHSPQLSPALPLRLLLSNVHTANRRPGRLISLIQREQPDVIVLEEVNDRWMTDLETLEKDYPFSKWIPREDNFGIAVLSRIALADPHEIDLKTEVPTILTGIKVGGQIVTLLATHPLPPGSKDTFEARNTQLRGLATLARQSKGTMILIGDLNVTPWSPDYARLIRDSGLRNARRGRGIIPTWPTFFPFLMIPLDHCLISPSLNVADIRSGSNIGSDHLPLIVDLLLPTVAEVPPPAK